LLGESRRCEYDFDELAIELEEYCLRTRGMVGCSLPMQLKLEEPIEELAEFRGGGPAAERKTVTSKQKVETLET
jgi:hypothetical protein